MLVVSGGHTKQRLSRTEFEEKVYHLIASTFQNYRQWYVIEERRKYNPAESEYIYEQNRGDKPHVVEVYFEGEFVCDVRSNQSPEEAKKLITKSFHDLIAQKESERMKKEWSEKSKEDKVEIQTGIKLRMPKICDVQGCYNEPMYKEKRGNLCQKHYNEFAKKGKI